MSDIDDLLGDLQGPNAPDTSYQPDPDTTPADMGRAGYLVRSPIDCATYVRTTDDDATLALWMAADIHATGKLRREDGQVQYLVRTRRDVRGGIEERESVLPAKDLARAAELNEWLINYAAPAENPPAQQGGLSVSGRLVKYLESHEPPTFRLVPLGLDVESGRFITADGAIGSDGWRSFSEARPDPRSKAPWSYGHDVDTDGCRAELEELLDFHELRVSAVVLSWLVATTLKPLLTESPVFPALVVQVSAGKGKSNGLLSSATAAFGRCESGGSPTDASLRRALGSHVSGACWVDEVTEQQSEAIAATIRKATTGQDHVKVGGDSWDQDVRQKLTASILLTSEVLGAAADDTERAMKDRTLALEWGDPTGRPGKEQGRTQYDDILDQMRRYGGTAEVTNLNALAGGIVQLILQNQDRCVELRELLPRDCTSRSAWKYGILKLGARVLNDCLGGHRTDLVNAVDLYVQNCVDFENTDGQVSALTHRFLPWALSFTQFPTSPDWCGGTRHNITNPVVQGSDGVMWVSFTALAELLRAERVDQRGLGTKAALVNEGRACGICDEKKRLGSREYRSIFWRVPDVLAHQILTRAQGGVESPGTVSAKDAQTTLI